MISFCGLHRNHSYHFYTTGYMPELETAHKRSLRLGDAEPILGFDKAQVSCKFYLGLHYKSSSQLQILPGHYTTKWQWACLRLQQSSSQLQILPGSYTTKVALGQSQLQILPGPFTRKATTAMFRRCCAQAGKVAR